jgi:chromosome partitioning protein
MSPASATPRPPDSSLEGYQAINAFDTVSPRPLPPKRQRGPYTLSMWGKGGSGKSTSAIQLAGIAAFLGHRVLILDVDPQGSSAAWRSLRDDDTIAVQSGRPDEVEKLLQRAGAAGFDLVLIDNAPGKNSYVSRVAGASDLSIILARPSPFDLLIGRDWVRAFAGRKFVIVISAAPPSREGQDSPLVRDARQVLRGLGGRVWRRQLTARHAVVQCIGRGKTAIEAHPFSLATQEYSRLWNSIVNELLGASE